MRYPRWPSQNKVCDICTVVSLISMMALIYCMSVITLFSMKDFMTAMSLMSMMRDTVISLINMMPFSFIFLFYDVQDGLLTVMLVEFMKAMMADGTCAHDDLDGRCPWCS
jgi:hypothetical protein